VATAEGEELQQMEKSSDAAAQLSLALQWPDKSSHIFACGCNELGISNSD